MAKFEHLIAPRELGWKLRDILPEVLPAGRPAGKLTAEGAGRLDIYDVSGALVRTLESGTKEAGLHEAVWNGRDDEGRLAPAGVYFYRLDADGVSTTKRMTLVK